MYEFTCTADRKASLVDRRCLVKISQSGEFFLHRGSVMSVFRTDSSTVDIQGEQKPRAVTDTEVID